MSKRVDSPIFGLPHRGHSLGDARLCFRFFTTSRKLRSTPMDDCAPVACSALCAY